MNIRLESVVCNFLESYSLQTVYGQDLHSLLVDLKSFRSKLVSDCSNQVLLEFFLFFRIKWSQSNLAIFPKTNYLTANQRKTENEKEKMKITWIHMSRNYLTNHFILQIQVIQLSQIFDDCVYIIFDLDIALEVQALHGIKLHCYGSLAMHRS